ncbi:NAD(P)(+) transhydrogenase (Re/Si-specific) subunit beta [Pseudobacteriovorax antillogorgiicola]|uniref:NAD(P) transhydrogenase subunit beta n=1 Tax=Pseudobacteriovorax antillogorgiicola TaxID=1513793 RepID=A0A1Y6CJ21_9BACT|nr:NAD(P)(+) transhydrogenase (Re/Si-specific) subunit beta [Pseudobacteriovorax antillogorgiicola]TCS48299.1 NAD(P) transhydrogenase subunit beta [Pseudobacteriovorax antillogorgiicola]SMF56818.1 NAD(P) transhydrogenase subunit beta [Pseudobacteriovorax antillogorgiicola]
MTIASIIEFIYILAAIAFIFGLKMLSKAETARQGNLVSSIGMLMAVVATLVHQNVLSYQWIIAGGVIGASIGAIGAFRVKMTGMPEMVALFNGFGGAASLLVGLGEILSPGNISLIAISASYLAILIGSVTLTGSIIAWAKLAERMNTGAIFFKGQKYVNGLVATLLLVGGAIAVGALPHAMEIFLGLTALALVFGLLLVLPIGGADMPVVIALLNSYSGIAASAAGFAIGNNVLIVAGSLVGASGLILTNIMCKSMNRSLASVLFASLSDAPGKKKSEFQGEARPINASDAYLMLEAARSVLFVPGYGMAVAQAQHTINELAQALESNGCDVRFAIHPVAGRMPGHMNVLLAEASVPYEKLVEPEDVNPLMEQVDVTVVVGANDVVNPASRTDEHSPLFGMPIIDVDRAKSCLVLKRSLKPGFAGVDNPLFFGSGTRMLLGDAKHSLGALVSEFKM